MSGGPAAAGIAAAIGRRGPLPFSEVMEAALYDDSAGFYASGGSAGRRGDFLTSPEVGPLFGAVVAGAIDTWWRDAGCPDPYVVVEAGAGPGTLARTVLAASPTCAPALRYVLVERSATQRRRHRAGLPLVDPAFALPPATDDDEWVTDDGPAAGGQGKPTSTGPSVVSLGEMPRVPIPAVVIANELLDNLPFDVLEWRSGQWHEVLVGLGDAVGGAGAEAPAPRFVETLVPVTDPSPPVARVLARCPAAPADGARIPVQVAAARWVRDALEVASSPGGRLVVFDYGVSATATLADRPAGDWLRTYRAHHRGSAPLDDLGSQDITTDVAVDQLTLAGARPPDRVTAQADWLRSYGLDGLVEAGRRQWRERAATGDLAAIVARSRVTEAEALTDASGLGAFRVLEWLP